METTIEVWTKEQLKYAFAMEMVKQVIEAKEHVLDVERTYFFTCFPTELIVQLGLENPEQRKNCFLEALRKLPKMFFQFLQVQFRKPNHASGLNLKNAFVLNFEAQRIFFLF